MRLPAFEELRDGQPHAASFTFGARKWDDRFARNFLIHFIYEKGLGEELVEFIDRYEEAEIDE